MSASDLPSSVSLPVGLACDLRVCASIANIGSGFDCIGIGLGIYDQLKAEVISRGLEIAIEGEGEDSCCRGESHLVYRGMQRVMHYHRVQMPGLHLQCTNTIPQARGLGSSASAYVGGLALGAQLLQAAGFSAPSRRELIDFAGEFEGHADNSSASIFGGAIVSWHSGQQFHATQITLCSDIQIYICIPVQLGYTAEARGVLPDFVPHSAAVFNLSRTALLVHALTKDPELLFDATDDALHQPYRRDTQVESYALLKYFRECGLAAFIAGAGPTVAVLATDMHVKDIVVSAAGRADFMVLMPGIGRGIDL